MASSQSSVGHSYTIGGVKVQFPCKAYPSQLSMMDKIVKAIDRCQNSLLESPTGSGKSLALLCSALAWQAAEYESAAQLQEEESEKTSSCMCQPKDEVKKTEKVETTASPYFGKTVPLDGGQGSESTSATKLITEDDEDDDFKPTDKKFRTPNGAQRVVSGSVTPASPIQWQMQLTNQAASSPDVATSCSMCQCERHEDAKTKTRKVPKIYFGTRTHKQIAQITRELRKTAYKNVKMSILASREHTCIDPEVSRSSHKNEECKNKLDGPGCRFQDNVRKLCSHKTLQRHYGLNTAWDIEDLVHVCKKKAKACPYFVVRQLKDTADIIFCPYNYLVDPIIRDNMDISLADQIVILDEAHNIEDSAREAVSYSVTQTQLQDTADDINKMVELNIKPAEHTSLGNFIANIDSIICQQSAHLSQANWNDSSHVLSGVDFVALLRQMNLGSAELANLGKCLGELSSDENEDSGFQGRRDPNRELKLKSASLSVLERLLVTLQFMFKNNLKFMNDYRVAIVKTVSYQEKVTDNMWLNKRKRAHREAVSTFSINFWCLNPEVAFSEMGEQARSIIVTSGTLSPMSSFQSELGVPFPIQLEANHVVGNSQVWVGTVGYGPNGTSLLANYNNSETLTFQDSVGKVVLEICKTVPHGILCFLPSYKMLEKLSNRWKSTGLWQQICEHKAVLSEPRASDKQSFDEHITHFYEVIKDSEQEVSEENECASAITGALFLAVCRGKVSEGLDFADNNARAVITVGIPFPNVKDVQVEQKKRYNNQYCISRGLLSGNDWYEIQAYRALNQALGRCIRHRHDWGALVLIDERYGKHPQKYIKGLSKWVRQKVQHYPTFSVALDSLNHFTQNRLKNSVVQPSTPSLTQSPVTPAGTDKKAFPIYPESTPKVTNENALLDSPSAVFLKSSTSQREPTPYERLMPLKVKQANQQFNYNPAIQRESDIKLAKKDSVICNSSMLFEEKNSIDVPETSNRNTKPHGLSNDKNQRESDKKPKKKGNVTCSSAIMYEDEDTADGERTPVVSKTTKPKSLREKLQRFVYSTSDPQPDTGINTPETSNKHGGHSNKLNSDVCKQDGTSDSFFEQFSRLSKSLSSNKRTSIVEKQVFEKSCETCVSDEPGNCEASIGKRSSTPPLFDSDTESQPMSYSCEEAAFDAAAQLILQQDVKPEQLDTTYSNIRLPQPNSNSVAGVKEQQPYENSNIKQQQTIEASEIKQEPNEDSDLSKHQGHTVSKADASRYKKALFIKGKSSKAVPLELKTEVKQEKKDEDIVDTDKMGNRLDNKDECEIVVRRSKRRRSLSKSGDKKDSKRIKPKGQNDQPRNEVKNNNIKCRKCSLPLTKDFPGKIETIPLPNCLSVVLESLSVDRSSACIVTSKRELVNCHLVKEAKGVPYNCFWSEVEACCVRYVCCAHCADELTSDVIAGAEVIAVTDSTSSYKTGQVFLLQT